MFLENSKMIMAKLKVQCLIGFLSTADFNVLRFAPSCLQARDWGELDGNLAKMRICDLQRVMKAVIAYGVESIDPEPEPLKVMSQ